MVRLHIMAVECKYKEMYILSKEQTINGFNNNDMTVETICKPNPINNTSSVMNEQVLTWMRRVETQRNQNAMLDNLKENKELNAERSYKPLVNPLKNKIHQKGKIVRH